MRCLTAFPHRPQFPSSLFASQHLSLHMIFLELSRLCFDAWGPQSKHGPPWLRAGATQSDVGLWKLERHQERQPVLPSSLSLFLEEGVLGRAWARSRVGRREARRRLLSCIFAFEFNKNSFEMGHHGKRSGSYAVFSS